ncbi:MBL fold metallo-hydrolase [Leptospira sp. GIMC2001]|uniref:MBL fold metallo-hydrolase n=1 Tax=Leptospira sp. GIMC2001 TaxID=1513297 RepID=UPI00234A3214|nr:MBL fold metallo-hydrolase [Leptospira sp. GIMC2001]WCL48884.1 MBL fold metallo-hydrolase [Leptospira sp. GIMC2001]
MKIRIHRGANEIGGNCIEVESNGERIILDIGLPLEAEKLGNDYKHYLPAIDGLNGSLHNLLAILISHPHIDHYGLLKYVNPEIPLGMGKNAWNILNSARFFKIDQWVVPKIKFEFEHRKEFTIGNFKITPYLVDHSAFDSYSLLIESEGKRIFYTGDFRLHGKKSKMMESLIQAPPTNIDLLLMEGTNISESKKDRRETTEDDLLESFYDVIKTSKGITLIQTSSQNIDRIVTIYKACRKAGKKLVIDLYTAMILKATGSTSIPQSHWDGIELYLTRHQRYKVISANLFSDLTLHSKNRIYLEQLINFPNNKVLIFRPSMLKDFIKNESLFVNAKFIYSLWEGYWERESNRYFKSLIERNNITKISIHTSGHVYPKDWLRFGQAFAAKSMIPIHSFASSSYKEYFPNTIAYKEGEWHEI